MFDNESLLVISAQALPILQKIPASVVEPDLLRKRPRNMGLTRLHLAAYFGINNKVSELLEQGHECNIRDFWGRTPLSWAAYGGHTDVMKTLLESGTDPEQLDYWGTVPLACAADRGHEDMVLAFLSRITESYQRTFAYGHILSSVIRTGNARLRNFVPSIEDLRSYRNFHAQSLLSEAAYYRNKVFVETLLAEGFDADTRDYGESHSWWSRKGSTPLMWAALTGQESTMQLLLQRGANPHSTDDSGRNVLSYAAEGGFGSIVRWFVNMCHTSLLHGIGGRTALAWAARNGHDSVIRLLFDLEVDKGGQDNHGWTAIARTAEGSHTSSVKLLIDLGLDSRILNASGWKALTWAIDAANEPLVRVLLENGDDPNSRDNDSQVMMCEWSPLQFAARQGHVGVMKALLDHRAGPLDGRDWEFGRSPISQAAEYGCPDMVNFLIEKGIDPDSEDINGDQPFQNNERKTPMMWASIHGYRDVVGTLLQHGANPNAKDLNGRTPLVCAAEYSRVDIIRRLLECGAEFDNRDAYSGRTPLSLASQYGYTAVVRPLLQQGADPNSKDDDGQSSLAWASETGHEDTCQALLDHGVHPGRENS